MFDQYVFIENSCKNYEVHGQVAGFELQTLITYYRGIPLSMLNFVGITVDGIPVPEKMLRVSVDKTTWFTMAEVETVTAIRWEYGEPLHIRVVNPGGLRPGAHDVKLELKVWPAYYPMPAGGDRTRQVVIA